MQKQNSATLEILSLLDVDEEDNKADEIDENVEVAQKKNNICSRPDRKVNGDVQNIRAYLAV